MDYEELLDEATQAGLKVMEDLPFESNARGLIKGRIIGINRTVRTAKEKGCVLAEELGHYHTTVGNILNPVGNRKQELQARRWAVRRYLSIHRLIDAYRIGCGSRYEMAEYLNVTEEYLEEALELYRAQYGTHVRVDDYVIYFEPHFNIAEVWERSIHHPKGC